ASIRPGEGAWANWDFVPGDDVLFVDDFQGDRVGDFPRRWNLQSGNLEVVEWEGGRYVQVSANGLVALPLPRELPERFTVELSLSLAHGNSAVFLTTAPYLQGPRRGEFRGSAVRWARAEAGIAPTRQAGPEVRAGIDASAWDKRVVPVRVMAD